ncbi:hypothetical protein DM01DRAFT_324759 [Hesseltinella vesiculosa]|uniref:RRM domain-containing protein n=1 Tax=Hesseltinella vesiculosa TaxID=101127 RepID=A0A1X2GAC1_9FUNG|nr:hypothetical protein DM01DRAFT_324759 [Hesseltinella vesiculosa]
MPDWSLTLPDTPSPNYIYVSEISQKSTEKTVKEFFLFCGKIRGDNDNNSQVALIEFERESAARTAALLNNGKPSGDKPSPLIDDAHISVGPYFASEFTFDDKASDDGSDAGQEPAPKTRVVAEILANGYLLQDQIVAKGLQYDQKYHFSDRFTNYFCVLQNNAKQLDAKYRIWDKALEMHEKYKIQEKVDMAVNKAQEALQTSTGQKVYSMANQTMAQIAAVHYEAKRIQLQKLNTTDPNDEPHPSTSATVAPQSALVA